uniref:Uncharacterized protein n=1 Tax=Rhizophora mucronata TaxID=61149 RepID=A0A2P2KN18_RHIMU
MSSSSNSKAPDLPQNLKGTCKFPFFWYGISLFFHFFFEFFLLNIGYFHVCVICAQYNYNLNQCNLLICYAFCCGEYREILMLFVLLICYANGRRYNLSAYHNYGMCFAKCQVEEAIEFRQMGEMRHRCLPGCQLDV